MEEVSAGLYDANEGDDEERHELEHGADLADPGGQVDVAALLPVEHLGDEAGLERHHRHDQQGHREYLGGEMIIWIDLANSYYLIISKKNCLIANMRKKGL